MIYNTITTFKALITCINSFFKGIYKTSQQTFKTQLQAASKGKRCPPTWTEDNQFKKNPKNVQFSRIKLLTTCDFGQTDSGLQTPDSELWLSSVLCQVPLCDNWKWGPGAVQLVNLYLQLFPGFLLFLLLLFVAFYLPAILQFVSITSFARSCHIKQFSVKRMTQFGLPRKGHNLLWHKRNNTVLFFSTNIILYV